MGFSSYKSFEYIIFKYNILDLHIYGITDCANKWVSVSITAPCMLPWALLPSDCFVLLLLLFYSDVFVLYYYIIAYYIMLCYCIIF